MCQASACRVSADQLYLAVKKFLNESSLMGKEDVATLDGLMDREVEVGTQLNR